MARRVRARRGSSKKVRSGTRKFVRSASGPVPSRGKSRTERFVGRDPSPVLEHYPPKASVGIAGPPGPSREAPVPARARPAPGPSSAPLLASDATATPPPPASAPTAPGKLLSLERPFDVDEFAQQLGETQIRVRVPRDQLGVVLGRVAEFMGFGIYVYRCAVRPAESGILKEFWVELDRVDFSSERNEWVQFEEKGPAASPFGPSGERGER